MTMMALVDVPYWYGNGFLHKKYKKKNYSLLHGGFYGAEPWH